MKNLIFCLSLNFLASVISAQPNIEWQRALGGSETDTPFSIQPTSDGGSIMAGRSFSMNGDVSENQGDCDLWVVKLNAAGDIQWEKSHGGNYFDFAKSIIQTSDGGYIVAGFTTSLNGDVTTNYGKSDCWVVKLNEAGDIQWQKSFGGSENDYGECVLQTLDGGYIIGVSTSSKNGDVVGNHGDYDLWLVKLSDNGLIQWQKTLGGSQADNLHSIQLTADGGFVVGGHTCSNDGDVYGFHGESDIWVVKLNSIGDIIWQNALGGTESSNLGEVISTSDGGYMVAGETRATDGDVTSNHGSTDVWIVKLTNLGNIAWQKTLGGSNGDGAASILQTNDSGFIVAGRTNSTDGDVTENQGSIDFWVIKIDNSGEIQWQRTLGGSYIESAWTVIQTQDDGYILTGKTESNDGDVSGYHGYGDCWVVKLSPESVNVYTPNPPETRYLEIFPNPANDQISLKTTAEESSLEVRISDALGRKLRKQIVQNGAQLDISTLPNGLYTVTATTSFGLIFSNKLIICRE